MITMTEIARMTRVSQATVSRVLNGSALVSPEVKERVLACARAHNYQFNALAKGLQGSRTHLLGVILSDISNSFFADLEREIEARAREHDYSIILFNTDLNPARQLECLDVARRYRVDGVLFVPTMDNAQLWAEFVGKLDIPAVAITARVQGFDSFYLDHEQASRQAARHLAGQGYDRFLFVGPPTDVKYLGFARELESMSLRAGHIPYEDDDQFLRSLETCLDRPGPRTGIFANNDMYGVRVLRALWDMGVRVPEDAGVIGFDDTSIGRYSRPSLSTISQPLAQMAGEAVTRLFHRIDHPHEAELLDRPFPAALVSREST